MLITKGIINNKVFNFLRFRALFFFPGLLCFFITTKTKMSDLDKLKNSLMDLGFKFDFFNDNSINFGGLSSLNSYLACFKGSFFVVYLNSFVDLNKLYFDNCFMLASFYRGYFLNNHFLFKLNAYYKFFCMNYLFFISFSIFFSKVFLNIVFYVKTMFLLQIRLRIEQLTKNQLI